MDESKVERRECVIYAAAPFTYGCKTHHVTWDAASSGFCPDWEPLA